jgi:hypothetical protein
MHYFLYFQVLKLYGWEPSFINQVKNGTNFYKLKVKDLGRGTVVKESTIHNCLGSKSLRERKQFRWRKKETEITGMERKRKKRESVKRKIRRKRRIAKELQLRARA